MPIASVHATRIRQRLRHSGNARNATGTNSLTQNVFCAGGVKHISRESIRLAQRKTRNATNTYNMPVANTSDNPKEPRVRLFSLYKLD